MGFIDNARGPVYPYILRDFALTPATGAWFFSIASLGGVASTITHGYWLKKFGPFKAIRFFIFAMALSCYGLGNLVGNSFYWLLTYAFIFGFSTGGNGICMNLLTAWSSPVIYRRRVFAGLHSTYALASLIAPFILAYLLHQGFRWEGLFKYFSIVPAGLLLWSFTLKEPENKYKHIKNKSDDKWKVLFGLALGFYVSAEIVTSSRLVLYCTQRYNWEASDAALYLSLFFGFLLLGRLIFATFHFKGSNSTWLLRSLALTIFIFSFGLYIHPFGLSLVGLTMSFFFPCFIDWVSEFFPEQAESIISSMLTSMGIMIILMHTLVGQINQQWGIQVAMHIGPVFCIISFLIILYIRKRANELHSNEV